MAIQGCRVEGCSTSGGTKERSPKEPFQSNVADLVQGNHRLELDSFVSNKQKPIVQRVMV